MVQSTLVGSQSRGPEEVIGQVPLLVTGNLDRKGSRSQLEEMLLDLPADILKSGPQLVFFFDLQNLPAKWIILPENPGKNAPVIRVDPCPEGRHELGIGR
jgi:hypothetical protein